MKKTRFYLGGGALVLALALVMGCAAPSSGTSSDWDPNTDSQKTWKKSNGEDKVLRSFEGFGAFDVNNGAVVKIQIGDSKASKAGVLFDYRDYAKDKGTVQYYQVGVGTSGYDGSTPEFYLSKVEDIKPDDINVSSSGEAPTGASSTAREISIQGNVTFQQAVSAGGGASNVNVAQMAEITTTGKMTTYVGFIVTDSTTGSGTNNAKVVKLRLGWYDEARKQWKAGAYIEQDLKTGENWGGQTVSAINGKLCAYAMLKKAPQGQTISTENSYLLINRTGRVAE